MTINQCINALLKLKDKHGEIEVYFDCPMCLASFTPNKIVTLAIHLTDDKRDKN